MKTNFNLMTFYSALLASITALGYAYFFLIAKDQTLSSLFLMLSGFFVLEVFIALALKLRSVDEGFAAVVGVLGVIGAAGTAIHGGFDLANAVNMPATLNPDLPSQVDPRGLLTFGVTGLALLKASWLMSKDKYFPKNLSLLGWVSGTLLIIIYLARLTVLSPANPWLKYPVLLEGFLVGPLWYLWLALVFKKKS